MNNHVGIITVLLATPGVDPLAVWVRNEEGSWLSVFLPHALPVAASAFTHALPLLQRGSTPLQMAGAWGRADAVALLQADRRVAAALAAEGYRA